MASKQTWKRRWEETVKTLWDVHLKLEVKEKYWRAVGDELNKERRKNDKLCKLIERLQHELKQLTEHPVKEESND